MDGVILINKEKEYTSNDVVQIVKHIFNCKTGHTGTLDPNATGILPILLGHGTKISKYLINHDKVYEATLQLGIKTDTADGQGKIIEKKDVRKEVLDKNNIKRVFKEFIGKQEQIPPMYSAIKLNGKKLYECARKGIDVKIEPREIEIYNIKLTKINMDKNQIEFIVKCSKGTYIRTLCEDISKKLDNIGYMAELKRTQVGEFGINEAINISELKKNRENFDFICKRIIRIEDVLNRFKKIQINANEIKRFLNGVKINKQLEDGIYRIYNNNDNFIGTGIIKNHVLKRDIVV